MTRIRSLWKFGRVKLRISYSTDFHYWTASYARCAGRFVLRRNARTMCQTLPACQLWFADLAMCWSGKKQTNKQTVTWPELTTTAASSTAFVQVRSAMVCHFTGSKQRVTCREFVCFSPSKVFTTLICDKTRISAAHLF